MFKKILSMILVSVLSIGTVFSVFAEDESLPTKGNFVSAPLGTGYAYSMSTLETGSTATGVPKPAMVGKNSSAFQWQSNLDKEIYGKDVNGNFQKACATYWHNAHYEKTYPFGSSEMYFEWKLAWWKKPGNSCSELTTYDRAYITFQNGATASQTSEQLVFDILPDGSIKFMGDLVDAKISSTDEQPYIGVSYDLRDKEHMYARLYFNDSYIATKEITKDIAVMKTVDRVYNMEFDFYDLPTGFVPDSFPTSGSNHVHTNIQGKVLSYTVAQGNPVESKYVLPSEGNIAAPTDMYDKFAYSTNYPWYGDGATLASDSYYTAFGDTTAPTTLLRTMFSKETVGNGTGISWQTNRKGKVYPKTVDGNLQKSTVYYTDTDTATSYDLKSDKLVIRARFAWWKKKDEQSERTTLTKIYMNFADEKYTAGSSVNFADDSTKLVTSKLIAEIKPDGSVYLLGADTEYDVYKNGDGKNADVQLAIELDFTGDLYKVNLYACNSVNTAMTYIASGVIKDTSLSSAKVVARTCIDLYDVRTGVTEKYPVYTSDMLDSEKPIHTGIQFKILDFTMTKGNYFTTYIPEVKSNISIVASQGNTNVKEIDKTKSANIKVSVEDNTVSGISANCYIAFYGGTEGVNQELLGVKLLKINVSKDNPSYSGETGEFTVPTETTGISAFVFDNSLIPLIKRIDF